MSLRKLNYLITSQLRSTSKKLVYTVDSKSYNNSANTWTLDTFDYSNTDSALGDGKKWAKGDLRAKGEAAVELLGKIGFDITGYVSGETGLHADGSNNNGATVELTFDPAGLQVDSSVNNGDVAARVLTLTANDVTDAEINETAFNQANALISMIATQLKTGYILDVEKATNALAGLIDHHNAFLGASTVAEARKLKSIIKVVHLQTAASDLGQATVGICTSTSEGQTGLACVEVGEKFRDISGRVNASCC